MHECSLDCIHGAALRLPWGFAGAEARYPAMTQVTWRAPDELVERVRKAAERLGRSLNDYLTRLAEAAVDPELAGDEAERLRERLTQAGLIVAPGPARRRPDQKAVALARRRAGSGTPLSELVKQGRG